MNTRIKFLQHQHYKKPKSIDTLWKILAENIKQLHFHFHPLTYKYPLSSKGIFRKNLICQLIAIHRCCQFWGHLISHQNLVSLVPFKNLSCSMFTHIIKYLELKSFCATISKRLGTTFLNNSRCRKLPHSKVPID